MNINIGKKIIEIDNIPHELVVKAFKLKQLFEKEGISVSAEDILRFILKYGNYNKNVQNSLQK